MGIKFQSAVLLVKDIAPSREFYEKVLGQAVDLDHGECVSFSAGFSIWQKAHAQRIIPLPHDRMGSSPSVELYFESEELDNSRDLLQASEVEFVHDVIEHPWGQRVFRVLDPDGYLIEIGEPMEEVIRRFLKQGLSPAEVGKRTSMPIERITLQQQK